MRKHLTAALVFLVLVLILTNPLILHIWNGVEDRQDGLLNTWILAWVGHALVTDPLNLFNTNIFYPYPNTLAFSEILLPPSLFALPITLATNNPILGYNLALLAMLWLDAFGMYLLVYDMTRRVEAGWIAGAIYAFNPFNLGNFAQLQLLTLGFLPLALLFLRKMLSARPEPDNALARITLHTFLFSFFFILQSLASFYYALLSGFAVALYLGWWCVQERKQLASSVRRVAVPLVASLALCGIVLTPFTLPYLQVQRELGFQRGVQESEPFSAALKQFTEVAPENLLYGKVLAPNPVKRVGGYALDNLFPGLVAVGLAIMGLAFSGVRTKTYLLVLLLASFLLALGPRLYVTSELPTDISLPYRWLYELLPPLRALRAPVRFDALINLALAGLAGLGGAVLVERVGSKRAAFAGLGVVALIALEYLALPAARIGEIPVANEIPALYKRLAREDNSVVLEVPMMGPDANNELDISTQYFTTYHWNKTPDGYSGFVAPRRGEIAYEMENWHSLRGIALLSALGVDLLVDHKPGQQCIVWGGPVGFFKPSDGEQVGDACVYRIPAREPQPKLAKQVYAPPQVQAGAPFFANLILTNEDPINAYGVKPTDLLDLTAQWSDGRTEQITTPLPLVTSSVSVVPLWLQAPSDAGIYDLRIATTDALTGAFETNLTVNVGNESEREVVLPAAVELAAPLQPVVARGGKLAVELRWLPFNKIDAYLSASVRLLDENGNKVMNFDRQPIVPTLLWRPDESVADTFVLDIPQDIPPGSYKLEVMMYQADSDTGALLLDRTSHTPQPSILLGEVNVN